MLFRYAYPDRSSSKYRLSASHKDCEFATLHSEFFRRVFRSSFVVHVDELQEAKFKSPVSEFPCK
jgi:hypothetical protein